LITDYGAGLIGKQGVKPVDMKEVVKVFNQNNEKVKKLIFEIIKNIKTNSKCLCQSSLKNASI
jgi:5'-methylthioadenosine phosphorylase